MLRQCFEMSTPLRAMNENRYFMIGNLVAILVNAGFIFATFDNLGLLAAPIGSPDKPPTSPRGPDRRGSTGAQRGGHPRIRGWRADR